MTWKLERDADGQPKRLVWTGPEEETFEEVLQAELNRCAECGFPLGWHKPACSHRASNPEHG